MKIINFGIIKCDSEGKILEFNNTSEKIFKCKSKEIINKKRIFYFFTKTNILENIKKWMKLSKIKETKIYTILKTKKNKKFTACIIINPYQNNNDIYFLLQIYPQKKMKKK